jgi:hypothetical protein
VICSGDTPHCCAAAPTNMARALAPARRMGSQRSFRLEEPPGPLPKACRPMI